MSPERFVEVADEPRHHPRLENDFVRVYDFQLRPGEVTLYHRHDEDTFYVAIEPARILDQPFGEAPATETVSWPAGIAWCRGYGNDPVIHRVTNSGDETMRVIGAEMRATPAKRAAPPLRAPAYELKYEDPRLRVYRLELEPGESTREVTYDFSALFVAVSPTCLSLREGSREQSRSLDAGDIYWHEGMRTLELQNAGTGRFRAYLAQWL